MITGKDIYDVLAALVPLYVAMILAYGSVRWWKIFTPDQCSGINRFVAVFAVPLLSFHFISNNDPYTMNYLFLAADSLQKIVILILLFIWQALSKKGSIDWLITLFSLSTLPNTLVMGIPLLESMYGKFSGTLMVQTVVLQSVIWYTLMLFLFEYKAAKVLISEQFPENAASITSFKVDSDVVSLNGTNSGEVALQADTEIDEDGKIHVVLRRRRRRRSSSTTTTTSSFNKLQYGLNSMTTPRASNLTGVEIYSVQSSREPTPRGSSFNHTDFYTSSFGHIDHNHHLFTPRTSNFDHIGNNEMLLTFKNNNNNNNNNNHGINKKRLISDQSWSMSNGDQVLMNNGDSYPTPNPMFSLESTSSKKKGMRSGINGANKELHMFVWSSSGSPVSDYHEGVIDLSKANETATSKGMNGTIVENMNGEKDELQLLAEEGSKLPSSGSDPFTFQHKNVELEGDQSTNKKKPHQMPSASVMTKLILIMVWRKLIRNPNTYASVLGLLWSLISFKFHIKMPKIVHGSIAILSNTGLGMAMFSLGLFMALQPKIIACGKSLAIYAMAVRFLIGPLVIAATSTAIGIRGVLLRVSILQAALPQGIVPFVFAKEYDVHADILSTAVIFGMLVALPIAIIYYVLLGL